MNMSLPIILEVAIGLAFLYLILSLIASELQESITAFLQWRAKHLKKSIYRMLGGKLNSSKLEKALQGVNSNSSGSDLAKLIEFFVKIPEKNFWESDRKEQLTKKNDSLTSLTEEGKIVALVNEIYQSTLISSLTQSTLGFSRTTNSTNYLYGPDSIPPDIFASALIEVLAEKLKWINNNELLWQVDLKAIIETLRPDTTKALLTPQTQKRLLALAEKAVIQKANSQNNLSDIQLFQIEIENWFKQSQNSTVGTYKRNSKSVLFWIGFAAAILVNADTLKMFQALYYQPAVREAITQSAIGIVKQECDSPNNSEACDEAIRTQISNLEKEGQLPIGWIGNPFTNFWTIMMQGDIPRIIRKIFGLIISGFAIMMGASFWFDLLKRFVNVRNSNPLLQTNSNSQSSENQE